VVEVTLARLGRLLLEPTYEMVGKHGSASTASKPVTVLGGIGATLIIRVDLRPPYRMFAAFAGQQRLQRNLAEKKPDVGADVQQP
jgi:hypothetical protein